jgi:FlaA1/EpsC-like NDP-sugar epimerase
LGRSVRILIAGAGLGGVHAAREFNMTQAEKVNILGFVDDNIALQDTKVENIEVLGTTEAIPDLVEKHEIDEVIIAMPSVGGDTIKRIQTICSNAGVGCRVIPGAYDILTGLAIPQSIREVRFADLIKRQPAVVDLDSIRTYLENSTILVTGAGGSIGSELVRQLSNLGPKKLLLLDRSENSLTELIWDLRMAGKGNIAKLLIADLNNEGKLRRIFIKEKPEVVFHAAAFKHVYLMEMYPEEAAMNNIIASNTLFKIAIENNVKRLIAISTDKAVNATSIMGVSKRIMELIVKEYARRQQNTLFSAVRFGNVFNSDGSVVRLFRKQIEAGGPITITDPEVERYFMSVSEAAQLVIQAGAFTDNGSIYLLEMGEPLKILDVAREMCLLHGQILGETIDVEYIGLTEGEKMRERLANKDEQTEITANERVFKLKDESKALSNLDEVIDQLKILSNEYNRKDLLEFLEKIVPEYRR